MEFESLHSNDAEIQFQFQTVFSFESGKAENVVVLSRGVLSCRTVEFVCLAKVSAGGAQARPQRPSHETVRIREIIAYIVHNNASTTCVSAAFS